MAILLMLVSAQFEIRPVLDTVQPRLVKLGPSIRPEDIPPVPVLMPEERMRLENEEEAPPEIHIVPGQTSGIWRAIEDPNNDPPVKPDIYLGDNFQGITFTWSIPPDIQLAVGPNHVMEMVNSYVAIYDKSTGSQVYFNDLYAFTGLSSSVATLYDPRVAYDRESNRWIVAIDYTNWNSGSQLSEVVLMTSVDSDPTNGFYVYRINVEDPSGTWADYPMLGFNSWGIFITTNQFTWSFSYSTSKLLIIDKSTAYTGSALTMTQSNNAVFCYRVAQSMDPCNTAFLLKNYTGSANVIHAWKITGSASSPVFSSQFDIYVNPYSAPPPARQLGPNDNIDTGDPRLQDPTMKNGKIFLSFNEGYDWGSGTSAAIRYVRVDTATMAADVDITYGADNVDYYYGRVAPEDGCATMVFTRSSDAEYASAYITTKALGGVSFEPSTLIKAGEDNYYETFGGGRNRWGDYSGAYMDPSGRSVWVAGEYAWTPSGSYDRWATWLARCSCEPLYVQVEESDELSWRPNRSLFLGQVSLDLPKGTWRLYDASGRQIETFTGPEHRTFELSPGVYFMRSHRASFRFTVVR